MNPRILIKIGGRAFENEDGFKELAMAIRSDPGVEIIIVHGGGAEISKALKDAGRETVFVDGVRVTQLEDIEIIESVLSGTINERIAGWLHTNGVACRRMSGKTENLFIVVPLSRHGRDMGRVGEVKKVNAGVVLDTLKAGQVPVISPISADEKGESYNVNADSAAAALAAGAQCTDLVFITDVPGVLVDDAIQPSLTARQTEELIAGGHIKGGMTAKMESALGALNQGVPRVHIIQWQGPNTLEALIRQQHTSGTTVCR
jgi:acetylglutamate kinase